MSLTVRGTLRTDTSLGEANVTDQSEMEKKTERWFTKATLALTNANIACKRIIYASYLFVEDRRRMRCYVYPGDASST